MGPMAGVAAMSDRAASTRSGSSTSSSSPSLLCKNGHPIVKLKESLHWHQQPFCGQIKCNLCGTILRHLEPRWRCQRRCQYNVCEACHRQHWADVVEDVILPPRSDSRLQETAHAMPSQMRGSQEYTCLTSFIPGNVPHAIGLLLKQAWNVPEATSRHGRAKYTHGLATAPTHARAASLENGAARCSIDQLTSAHSGHGECHPQVVVEVLSAGLAVLAAAQSHIVASASNPVWNQVLSLPSMGDDNARTISSRSWNLHWRTDRQTAKLFAASNTPPEEWDADSTLVRLTLYDASLGRMDQTIGHCTVPLARLLATPGARWLLCDSKGDAVLSTHEPYMPCEVSFNFVQKSLPASWVQFQPHHSLAEHRANYPYHVFMMTRGTRGDVQPFIALARGLAEKLGWMVTICTELSFYDMVKKHSDVARGRIRFRPSGGNTEARMNSLQARLLLRTRSEVLQMMALANSEAEFFSSATVFIHHILEMEKSSKPVDLVVFGFTLTCVASIISEFCKKPIVGYILQPSCIPSRDERWKAVQAIHGHHGRSLHNAVEKAGFTSHGCLKKLKEIAEHNPCARWNIGSLRKLFRLGPADTWSVMKAYQIPLIVPIPEGIFERPADWWDGIHQTDFISLRTPSASSSLGDELESFLASARHDRSKIAIVTFSSMPVPRGTVLRLALKMLENCRHNLKLIYVGRQESGPADLEGRAKVFKERRKFFETARADFSKLFPHIDCFVVHGGLGTTVEAMRMKKPCCVTGPLLLDQRFWGYICFKKGVGPEPLFLDDFVESCADFVNAALDPQDPKGWQENARTNDWGLAEDDGVLSNVACLERIVSDGLTCIPAHAEAVSHARGCMCCSREKEPGKPIPRKRTEQHQIQQMEDQRLLQA
eukprot:TRINITY_DN72332_c0_g1_i1.p1 TRINITY_DN72332_c0_g1~~TRINITY_DN72332_c0_g1_i1.p1  ORF type:complete len:884 (-),score=141.56 TRINITY_DN72332_c0_g1_i1:325-2976(-)